MNKIKKIFLTLILSISILFTNISSSFANPLVVAPVTISYELLMALMGIGVTFGLALPKTDEEYWEYTRSLRNHLQVVDDDYLDKLDKSVKEWKTNNNNKPDEEKENLQVPFIPGLEKLFKNVGKDVSKNYSYVGDLINSVPVRKTSQSKDVFIDSITLYPLYDLDVICFATPNGDFFIRYLKGTGTFGNLQISYDNNIWYTVGNISNSQLVDGVVYVSPCYDYGFTSGGQPLLSTAYTYDLSTGANVKQVWPSIHNIETYLPLNTLLNPKPTVPYSPSNPDVDESGNISIDYDELPIPNVESIPGYKEGLKAPFDVQDPIKLPNEGINPSPNPGPGEGTNPSPNPGPGEGEGGGNLPDFPYWGEGLDFTPITESNISDKFPFCLAKDISNLIGVFDVEEKEPIFDVPFLGEVYQVDLAQFTVWADIIKFFTLITFIFGLIKITRGIIG